MISVQGLLALPSFVLVSALTILAPASASAQNRFAQAPVYPLGGSPGVTVAADFNGDGRADVLSIVYYHPTPSTDATEVVLATASASGAYPAPMLLFQLPSDLVSAAIVAGDFNEDSKEDFVLLLQPRATLSSPSIQVYLGNGDGTFRAGNAIYFETTGYSLSVMTGKVNKDNHTDLVVGATTGDARDTGGMVYVFLGQGNGTFAPAKSFTLSFPPASMTLGDLNLDGTVDLCIHDNYFDYQVMLANGDGTFRMLPMGKLPVNTYHVGVLGYGQMVVTDITGDGEPDLVFANSGEYNDAAEIPSLYVLEGYGDGTFHSKGILYDAGDSGSALALGDLNKDGFPDLVVLNPTAFTLSVRFGSSKGPSGSVTAQYAVPATYGVFIADANGDGRQDVLLLDAKGVQVLMNTGGGNLRAPKAFDIQTFSMGLQASDLNHDGYADLAIMGQVYDSVNDSRYDLLYLGLGNGGTKPTRIATGIQGESTASDSGAHFVALGYFNQDGNLDIATGGGVSFNNGKAQFVTYSSEPPNLGKSPQTWADYNTVTGDLNHDGKADIVSAGSATLMVSLGNGDGTFQTPVEYGLGGTDANAVMLRDINKDGNLDAITVNYGSSTVSVFLGNGDGTFKAPLAFAVSQKPLVLTTGDFNGDGKVDIAVASATNIFLLLGDGKGSFTLGKELAVVGAGIEGVSGIDGIVSSDLRGNGVFDLIVADLSTFSVYVLYGKGDGSFATPIAYSIESPTAIAAGDFNGDGAPDIAVSLLSATAVPIFYNQGGTRITLTSSSSNVAAGQTVTFRATVAASLPGTGSPSGTVAFKQGTVTLGRAPLRNGAATFSTSTLNKGSHTISAVYYGNNNFNPHISPGVGVTVR